MREEKIPKETLYLFAQALHVSFVCEEKMGNQEFIIPNVAKSCTTHTEEESKYFSAYTVKMV